MNDQHLQIQSPEPYTRIAPYYDTILRYVDYQEWYDYIKTIMLTCVAKPDLIVELGCGTGRFGAKFSNDNFTIFGIDRCLEMLRVAKTRAFFNFRMFCADIRNFTLAKKADFIFAVHDTMNYQLSFSDVRSVFRSVRNSIAKNGIFMFDVTTEYNIYQNFDGKTKIYEIQGATIEWSNEYIEKKKIISSLMTVKKKNGPPCAERHLQRIYNVEEIMHLLKLEGFELLHLYGDYTFLPPKKDTIMINFIARVR